MMKGSFDGRGGLWIGKAREPGAVVVYPHGRETAQREEIMTMLERREIGDRRVNPSRQDQPFDFCCTRHIEDRRQKNRPAVGKHWTEVDINPITRCLTDNLVSYSSQGRHVSGVPMSRIPGKLYELLPYLYSIAGMVMINYSESIIGDTFGLLLYLLAGLIFLKRSNYRQDIVNKIN
jgi:hypothetical protein